MSTHKKIITAGLALFLVFGVVVLGVYADGYGKEKSCSKWSLEDKFSKKVMFLMENEEDLELTDTQMDQIKALKLSTKKALIKMEAEIEVIGLDIKDALWEEEIDIPDVESMMDQKYALKAEKSKLLVNSYVKLKGILTEEQKDKMKSIWKEKKKSKMTMQQCPMMQGKMMGKK
ncbi:MAG: Spy/CpxP family protein refolding chaperone [Candidatus Omnitrophota bacterium]